MEKRIRCGILGAGWWGTFAHVPALLEDSRAELVAVQHHDRATADRIAGDFSIPMAFTKAEDLLAVEGLQAVVISSAPFLHYEQALAALSAGKHVLLEKPMTFTAAQAEELVTTADRNHLQLLIGCPWHYTEHASQAQNLIRDGRLGAIRMISILMTNPVDHMLRGDNMTPTHGGDQPYLAPTRSTWSDPTKSGGGQIYAQVSHVAAYLPFLTGARATEVFARFHRDGSKVDIYDALSLRMDDDSMVSISSTGATPVGHRDYEVRIFGAKGILYLDLWRGKMQFLPLNGDLMPFPDLREDEIYPHKAPAKNLIDAIINPSENRSPGWLGWVAMEIVEAACRSAESNKNIPVSSLKRPAPKSVDSSNRP